MRPLIVLFLAPVILFMASGCNKNDDPSGGKDKGPLDLSIMSFNIRTFKQEVEEQWSWDNRKEACVKMINANKPDIIGMQECVKEMRDYLAEKLTDYTLIHIPDNKKNFANVIWYKTDKFDVKDSGYKWLSDTPDTPSYTFPDYVNEKQYRTYIFVKLQFHGTGTDFFFYNTHLPPDREGPLDNDKGRGRCLKAIADYIVANRQTDKTVFLAGDMNTSYNTAGGKDALANIDYLLKSSRDNCVQKDNYHSFNSFSDNAPFSGGIKSIDHIFYMNCTPVSYKTIVAGTYGIRFVSDHYPIVFQCKVNQ